MDSSIVHRRCKWSQWLPLYGYTCEFWYGTGAALEDRLIFDFPDLNFLCAVREVQRAQRVLMVSSYRGQVQYHDRQAIVLTYGDSESAIVLHGMI